MATNTFIDSAKVMSKGQITIPKDIREILGGFKGRQSYFCCRKRKCPSNQFRSLCNADAPGTDDRRSSKSRTHIRGCSHGLSKRSTRRK